MLRSAASKTLWLAKGMAIFWGTVMTLALMLGVGAAALAAVPGDPLRVGQANAINALTRLVGSTNQELLRIDNNSAGPNATALDLRVEPGKPPMRVNSTVEVEGLNVDSLDGKDSTAFVSGKIYTVRNVKAGLGGGQLTAVGANCDAGDVVLGGGGGASGDSDAIREDTVNFSHPVSDGIWNVLVRDNDPATVAFAEARCADFPPLR